MARICVRILPIVVFFATAFSPFAYSCSLIEGNFYRVTILRGTVVGVDDYDFRHTIRWMRHQALLPDVNLTVYIYSSAVNDVTKRRPIKAVKTDKIGAFDFGPLPLGHYTVLMNRQGARSQ